MKLNGSAARKTPSWIETFVAHTSQLETPSIFRQWAAITILGAILEQKVWMMSPTILHPNLYTMLIGHPGVGKSRSINEALKYIDKVPDHHLVPKSTTSASLVDVLAEDAKRLVQLPKALGPDLDYNSALIAADEWGVFMHEYDYKMVGLLSTFYDPTLYGEQRRTADLKIKIKKPQLSILGGSTPSNLLKFMPEIAWSQGFMSRMIMIFSDERRVTDVLRAPPLYIDNDLVHDLMVINATYGLMTMTEDYMDAVHAWRKADCPPAPTHPKLLHYATRRPTHLLKLSMISSIDHGASMVLSMDDYTRAIGWLLEAEQHMPEIFKAAAIGGDAQAMDEIYHYALVHDRGKGVPEHLLIRQAAKLLPSNSCERALQVMEAAGRLRAVSVDKRTGSKVWKAMIEPED